MGKHWICEGRSGHWIQDDVADTRSGGVVTILEAWVHTESWRGGQTLNLRGVSQTLDPGGGPEPGSQRGSAEPDLGWAVETRDPKGGWQTPEEWD